MPLTFSSGPPKAINRSGFTLLEVVIVVLVIGILSVMATTSWKGIIGRMGASTAQTQLREAIEISKTDALTRRRHSGIVVDRNNRRFLRFVDSSTSGSPNGQFDSADRVLVDWTTLHPDFVIYKLSSSAAPQPVPRPCGTRVGRLARPIRGGVYSVVFRPDGSAWASLEMIAGIRSAPRDTFRLVVVPTTGLVTVVK